MFSKYSAQNVVCCIWHLLMGGIWWKRMSLRICQQQRPRSAHTVFQSDQDLCCALTKSLSTWKCNDPDGMPKVCRVILWICLLQDYLLNLCKKKKKKIMFDISCELSAKQTIHMKCQALFSLVPAQIQIILHMRKVSSRPCCPVIHSAGPYSTWPHWVDWAVKPQHKQIHSVVSNDFISEQWMPWSDSTDLGLCRQQFRLAQPYNYVWRQVLTWCNSNI